MDNWDMAAAPSPISQCCSHPAPRCPPPPAPAPPPPQPHLAPQLCRETGTKANLAPSAQAFPVVAQAEAAPSPERPPVNGASGWGFGLPAGPRPNPLPSLPQGSQGPRSRAQKTSPAPHSPPTLAAQPFQGWHCPEGAETTPLASAPTRPLRAPSTVRGADNGGRPVSTATTLAFPITVGRSPTGRA